jgi:hypothetical protein
MAIIAIPEEVRIQMRTHMRRQRGAAKLLVSETTLFANHAAGDLLFAENAGAHVFRIETGDQLALEFLYSSPGTGTRVATVDLTRMRPAPRLLFYFDWSPEATTFSVFDRDDPSNSVSSGGVAGGRKQYVLRGQLTLTVAAGGEMISVRSGDDNLFEIPAIESWRSTLGAVDVALTGTSPDERFPAVLCNTALVMLATGLETYLQARFLEMEREGIAPDEEAFGRIFMNATERKAGGMQAVTASASAEGVSVFQLLANRVNFLSFERSKDAYGKAFDIKFGELVNSQVIADIRRWLLYRHRIIHESASLLTLNDAEVPPAEPIFANVALASRARNDFATFVGSVHAATLRERT